jgi:AcrR family transcriptional regulator
MGRARSKASAAKRALSADEIVDATLDLAEERGWHDLRLYQVAEREGVGLEQISAHFRDLDAVANAWFARARDSMLQAPDPELPELPPPERLLRVMMRWFEALAPHREVSGEIIREKLWPAHAHHWVPAIFDLSRLMHWFLDAARIASTGRQRALAEIGLTLIFLRTLRIWLGDDTPDRLRTRAHLRKRLEAADRWLGRGLAQRVIR